MEVKGDRDIKKGNFPHVSTLFEPFVLVHESKPGAKLREFLIA